MSVFDFFKIIFGSKLVVTATALIAIIYYFVIEYFISLNAPGGHVFVTTPAILLYLLALSASILLVVSVYSMRFSFSRIESEAEGIASFVTTVLGGIIAGCNCAVPIIASAMYLLTLNALTVSGVLVFIGDHQIELFLLLIAFNILLSYHHLSKLSSVCSIKKGKIVAPKK